MAPTAAIRTMLAVMVAVAAVGGLDSARARSWDLVAIFGALIVGLLWLLLRTSVRRPLVPMRADLVRWISRRAAVSGETPSAVVDRALAAYRSGLTGEDGSDDANLRQ